MASRRKARELALQMLFQWEVGSHEPESVIANSLRDKKLDPAVEKFARALFEGTIKEIPALDLLISKHSKNWKIARMPAVDRNVLRMALYELIHQPETQPAVIINEALEIARRFSSEESVEFINGVLDGIRVNFPESKPKS
jgi:transcription antitermination protein NusB